MTIPTLHNNVQKQTTVVKLQKFYSNMSQAIELSEIDNGPPSTWEYGTLLNGASTKTWFDTYLKPYFKSSDIETQEDRIIVQLSDGVYFHVHNVSSQELNFYVFLVGKNTALWQWGKNIFGFRINKTNNKLEPYEWAGTVDAADIGTRNEWTSGTCGCSTTGQKFHCAGLIMYDGWQIREDYPYFN